MREAENRGQPYLFKLRLRRGVKQVLERAMRGALVPYERTRYRL
jgi:hypothetical protein